ARPKARHLRRVPLPTRAGSLSSPGTCAEPKAASFHWRPFSCRRHFSHRIRECIVCAAFSYSFPSLACVGFHFPSPLPRRTARTIGRTSPHARVRRHLHLSLNQLLSRPRKSRRSRSNRRQHRNHRGKAPAGILRQTLTPRRARVSLLPRPTKGRARFFPTIRTAPTKTLKSGDIICA